MSISNNVPNRIFCDPKRFKQVLFNLLGNAVKFTFKGYVRVNINFDQDSEMLTGTVEDTGIGIEEEDLDKLF
jgi:signal transduction histidine kinase